MKKPIGTVSIVLLPGVRATGPSPLKNIVGLYFEFNSLAIYYSNYDEIVKSQKYSLSPDGRGTG
jgi:hypothetical protein